MNRTSPDLMEKQGELSVAHVDPHPINRSGFDMFMKRIGLHDLVLSVGMGSELLQPLRAGLRVDVAFVYIAARYEALCVLLERLKLHHAGVRTIALVAEPNAQLEERARKAGATRVVLMKDLDEARLRDLLMELARPMARSARGS